MSRGPLFIEREVFERTIASIRTADGKPYQDVNTIYGDMSRYVVGLLAQSSPDEIVAKYNALSWGGTANGRALHEAAKEWLRQYHPHRHSAL